MSEPARMDRTFDIIIKRMVKTGQAPHYTEIAAELEISVEEGRQALHELFKAGSRMVVSQNRFHYFICTL